MKNILLILIITLLVFSCAEKTSDFESKTDINNQFSIDVPKGWALQNNGNEDLWIMRFTDTTKNYKNRMLFDVAWESNKTEFTPEFKVIMDSIATAKNWISKNQEFKKADDLNAYYYNVFANDSLGKFDFALDNRYLNHSEKDGTVYLTITRWKEELNESDSILAENIFNSLTRK